MQALLVAFPRHQMESQLRGASYGTTSAAAAAAAGAPSRRTLMAIDALLNPTLDDDYRSRSHYHPSTSSGVSPRHSPTSAGRREYFYPQYRDSHQPHYTESAGGTPHHHTTTAEQALTPSHSHRSQSGRSSPDPCSSYPQSHSHSRERYDSVSSSSSTNAAAERRRPPRPKYEEEEMYFIWYHRVDLSQEWKEVRESFNQQFADRQRRGFQGIQCKFYRFIKEKKCPTLREQRRMRDGEFLTQGATSSMVESGAPRFGVVEWMGVWYPWMRESREEVRRRRIVR